MLFCFTCTQKNHLNIYAQPKSDCSVPAKTYSPWVPAKHCILAAPYLCAGIISTVSHLLSCIQCTKEQEDIIWNGSHLSCPLKQQFTTLILNAFTDLPLPTNLRLVSQSLSNHSTKCNCRLYLISSLSPEGTVIRKIKGSESLTIMKAHVCRLYCWGERVVKA